MKKKTEEKLTFSSIEKLFMVVMVAMVIISGSAVFTITTRNKNVANLKDDAESIISASKNAYAAISMKDSGEYIIKSEDETEKGMCITLKGLSENNFLTKDYSNWNGYVVIEEKDHTYHYSIWLTDKRFVIDGYDSEKISELELNKGITAYNKDDFTSKVKTSFAGTTQDKGGTGTNKENGLMRFEGPCVDKKIE